MQAPINQEALQEKWAPLLDADGQSKITDPHRRMVTAVLLENQEQALREEKEFLYEQPTNSTTSSGTVAGFSASATGAMQGFVSYSKVTKILPRYKILLMPYQNKVGVLIKGIDVSKYFSPLKLFEYMASGRPIIASNLKVYRNILKHNYNSILLKQDNITDWTIAIKKIMYKKNYSYLGKNARNNAKNYSWKSRAQKIIKFYEK